MIKKHLAGIAIGASLLLTVTGAAFAAPNPNGTGQPSVECDDPGAELSPHGFTTGGFENAEAHYAGSDNTPSQANAQSPHAVSQYDVACYQFTQNHQ